jgi:hypothetical protein
MHAGPHVFSRGLGHEAPLVIAGVPGKPGSLAGVVIVCERNPLGWKLDHTTKAPRRFYPDTLIVCEKYETRFTTDSTGS